MGLERFAKRMFALVSGVDVGHIENGKIDDSEWEKLVEASDLIGTSNFKVDDTPGISVFELRNKCLKCCTIRINGTPVPLQRYGQFAPTVRYPFLRLFIGSRFLIFLPFISKRYDSLSTRARLASA